MISMKTVQRLLGDVALENGARIKEELEDGSKLDRSSPSPIDMWLRSREAPGSPRDSILTFATVKHLRFSRQVKSGRRLRGFPARRSVLSFGVSEKLARRWLSLLHSIDKCSNSPKPLSPFCFRTVPIMIKLLL